MSIILNRVQNLEILRQERAQLVGIAVEGLRKGLDKLAESSEGGKVSSQKAVLHEAPQAFNQIEVRGIRRQKEEFNAASGLGAPSGILFMTIMSGVAPVWSLSLP